jgi:hypothetical protein
LKRNLTTELWTVEGFLAAALIAAGATPVASVFDDTVRLSVPAALLPADWPGTSPQTSTPMVLDHGGTVGLTLHPSGVDRMWTTLAALPSALATSAVLILLMVVVAIALRTSPFTSRAAGVLSWAGVVALFGGLAALAIEGVAAAHLVSVSASALTGATTMISQHWITCLVAGIGLSGLAAIFRRGAEMREELSEVI